MIMTTTTTTTVMMMKINKNIRNDDKKTENIVQR